MLTEDDTKTKKNIYRFGTKNIYRFGANLKSGDLSKLTIYFISLPPIYKIICAEISLLNKAKMLAKRKSNKGGGTLENEDETITGDLNFKIIIWRFCAQHNVTICLK